MKRLTGIFLCAMCLSGIFGYAAEDVPYRLEETLIHTLTIIRGEPGAWASLWVDAGAVCSCKSKYHGHGYVTTSQDNEYVFNEVSYKYGKHGSHSSSIFSGGIDVRNSRDGLKVITDTESFEKRILDGQDRNVIGRVFYRDEQVEIIDNNEFATMSKENETDREDFYEVRYFKMLGKLGEAYYTDITLDINDFKLPCYSVNGWAAVRAEDLQDVGFDLDYYNDRRMLYIEKSGNFTRGEPNVASPNRKSGDKYTDIFGSDINVTFDGRHMTSFYTEYGMLIFPEDIALLDETVNIEYSDAERTLYMTIDEQAQI